jgi:hypothetical protein
MNNLINFFWAGGLIPARIKYNLKNWVSHLKKSNSLFEVIVWSNREAIEILLEDEAEKKNVSSITHCSYKWTIGKSHVVIKSFDELCELEKFDQLSKMYFALIKNKLFPIASDIARIFILNKKRGVYLDCDMHPNENFIFPKTIADLELLFLDLNSNKLYLPFLNNTPENGMLFYFGITNGLLALINEMNDISENMADKISYDSIQHNAFIKSNENNEINNLFFNSNKYGNKYIDAYKKKSICDYRNVTTKKLKNYNAYVYPLNSNSIPKEVKIYRNGMPPWNVGFNNFFSIISSYFKRGLKESAIYQSLYEKNISNLIESQQDLLLLYTWSDPGYGTLTKLQYCANTIGSAYARKKGKEIKKLYRVQNISEKHVLTELIKIHTCNAYDEYVAWFNGRNSKGLIHRHGASGRERGQVLLNILNDAKNLFDICNGLQRFFGNRINRGINNQRLYGKARANPHSFITFFLNEIQKTAILYNKMKLQPQIVSAEKYDFFADNRITNANRRYNLEILSFIEENFIE